MFKLIILDFDGTLCLTHEAIVYCIMQTFKHHNQLIPSSDKVEKTIGMGINLEETFKFLMNEDLLKNTDLNSWIKTYRSIYNSDEGIARTTLFSRVEDTLTLLKKNNYKLLIVSNKGKLAIEKALAYFDIAKYLSMVIGDTPNIKSKPEPMVYEKLIKPHFSDVESHEVLVVGDTVSDIKFAKNIGAKSCWAQYGYGSHHECISENPDFVINNLFDLHAICGLNDNES